MEEEIEEIMLDLFRHIVRMQEDGVAKKRFYLKKNRSKLEIGNWRLLGIGRNGTKGKINFAPTTLHLTAFRHKD